jgi:ABC-type transport system involved in multi-copper enzyme maturation permease subunit
MKLTQAQRAIVKKDFGEVWSTKMVRMTILIVPAILVVFMPLMFLGIILFTPMDSINGADKLMAMLPLELKNMDVRAGMFYALTNMMCPMFFLMIPLMASTVSAACSFVGEKERSTIETLLLTPMSVRDIFSAKVMGCILISAVSTVVSFAAFCAVILTGNSILHVPVFLNWNWAVLLLLFAPAVTLFGVIFPVLISGKAKTFMEAQQLSGYVVMPVVLLFVGQFTGLFVLNALILLIISLVVFAADFFLMRSASKSFTPEKLLK